MKRIAILGATGSIGTQALEVISAHPEHFSATVLTAQRNADLLIRQALAYRPKWVVIGDEAQYPKVKQALQGQGISVAQGRDALKEVVADEQVDIVLTALVGQAGLEPTMAAIKAGKDIALANKETLVVAGQLVMEAAKKAGVQILPVDSEHSAIFQCLVGEQSLIEKIYLTASGGPFRGKRREDLLQATKAQALKHPNWSMGAKITIDSASMMNKGLEVIEARWLFGLQPHQVDVIVHPQSIIHSIVQMEDGSMKAQMGLPDMKLPIQYALTYPNRLPTDFERFDFLNYPALTFEQPDRETFRNLALAFAAMEQCGTAPCVLNAANEIAVEKFLRDEIKFLQIAELNEACLAQIPHNPQPDLGTLLETDRQTRLMATALKV